MSDTILSAEDREMVRHAALDVLVSRYPTAHPLRGIHRRVQVELSFPVTLTAVDAALEFLAEKQLARWNWDDLGSTKYWAATAVGMQTRERKA